MKMEKLITGYQYNEDGFFIGIYKFHKNLDKDEIHLPHNTTLTPIPEGLEDGQVVKWDGRKWK